MIGGLGAAGLGCTVASACLVEFGGLDAEQSNLATADPERVAVL